MEEMVFAAVNRRSDSHILKRLSIGKPALSLWLVVVPVNVLDQFLSRQNAPQASATTCIVMIQLSETEQE